MKITIKEFIKLLQKENQDSELNFSGLDFYRLKDRGDSIQVEFNQTVYKDEQGKVVVQNH